MTLNTIIEHADDAGVAMAVEAGSIVLDGPDNAVDELIPMVKRHKPELIQVLNGETVADVGSCEQCGADLLGLPTRDSYINRVCPSCGTWFRCLPPRPTAPKAICIQSTNSLFSKVAADLCGTGDLLPNYQGVE